VQEMGEELWHFFNGEIMGYVANKFKKKGMQWNYQLV
jgi:hypothetical protein